MNLVNELQSNYGDRLKNSVTYMEAYVHGVIFFTEFELGRVRDKCERRLTAKVLRYE